MEIDNTILYYLSHPFTSYGNKDKNKLHAFLTEAELLGEYGITVLNPITYPLGNNNSEAMEACRHLYEATKAIILCENWERSNGCMEEYRWAVCDNKNIYILTESDNTIKLEKMAVDDNTRIIELYKNFMSIAKIGIKLDIQKPQIIKVLKEAGILRPQGNKFKYINKKVLGEA